MPVVAFAGAETGEVAVEDGAAFVAEPVFDARNTLSAAPDLASAEAARRPGPQFGDSWRL